MKYRGFTLIEILLVVGIMLVITTLAVSGYNSYNDTQKVRQSAYTFRSNLRFAQSQATNGKKPASCGSLNGYKVSFTRTNYSVTPWCDGAAVTSEQVTVSFPKNVGFPSSYSGFTFVPLGKGVKFDSSPPSDYKYVVANSDSSIKITIVIDPNTGLIDIQ